MRDEESAVPLILVRATGTHGAHAEAGQWTARGTEEQYRALCGLTFLEL